MDDFFQAVGVVLMLLMVPVFYRMIVGPTAIDRIVAANIIGTKTAVLLVVIGTLFHSVDMFVDFALAYALLNFIGSLAAARYFARTEPGAPAGGGRSPAIPRESEIVSDTRVNSDQIRGPRTTTEEGAG